MAGKFGDVGSEGGKRSPSLIPQRFAKTDDINLVKGESSEADIVGGYAFKLSPLQTIKATVLEKHLKSRNGGFTIVVSRNRRLILDPELLKA